MEIGRCFDFDKKQKHQEILVERTGGHISCVERPPGVVYSGRWHAAILDSIICLTMVATHGRPVIPSGSFVAKSVSTKSKWMKNAIHHGP